MNKTARLVKLLGNIEDDLLLQAYEADNAELFAGYQKRAKRRKVYWAALAAAVFLLIMGFTSPGQAVAAEIKETLVNLWEQLFPPKDVTLYLEGMGEELTYTAHGELPSAGMDAEGNDETVFTEVDGEHTAEQPMKAGFVIYVDEESYIVEETEEKYLIRQIPIEYETEEQRAFYESLPKCQLEIIQEAGLTPEEAAKQIKEELTESFEMVSEIEESGLSEGLTVWAQEGLEWNSEIREYYFVDNGQGGVFIITATYFMEATEGHGGRFHSMIKTFEVLE